MSKNKRILFSVFTGLLLTPAWYTWGHGLFLLVALIPLLTVEDYLDEHKKEFTSGTFFRYSALAFFVWNTATTWWIYNATAVGVVIAILINTLMWSLVMWLFHKVKRRMGPQIGYFSLIIFWISWEYLYHNTEISWPWLSLGNGFAYNVKFIQWYEYTGILGGSLWILVVNVLLFNLIRSYRMNIQSRRIMAQLVLVSAIMAVPVILSLTVFYNYKETPDPKTVVVIQPNIDPYRKFVSIPSIEQTQTQLDEAAKIADSSVDYFIAPETSINNNIWLNKIEEVPDIQMIRQFLKKYPKASYVPGIQCYKAYFPGDKISDNARDLPGTNLKYESFNAAIQIDSTLSVPVYIKSKLVAGVETMPYAKYLKFLEGLTLKLGGTFRGWGRQDYRGVFFSATDSTGVSPVICYESVYGEFVTGYVKNGANILFVITNDGWWGDTPGYHQHNSLSSLRAIETRRSIARSANTGISGIINQRGEETQSMGWWKQGALKGIVNANNKMTFYVRHGDYIGRSATVFSVLVLLLLAVTIFTSKKSGI